MTYFICNCGNICYSILKPDTCSKCENPKWSYSQDQEIYKKADKTYIKDKYENGEILVDSELKDFVNDMFKKYIDSIIGEPILSVDDDGKPIYTIPLRSNFKGETIKVTIEKLKS